MSTLDDALVAANSAFMAAFGTPVTYHPRGGSDRAISAIVDYYPPARTAGAGPDGPVAPKRVIQVRNHATAGIAADTVQKYGQDRVTLPVQAGSATTETLAVFVPPLEQGPWADAGMLTLWLV